MSDFKYPNGVIYVGKKADDENIYIGSCTNSLSNRFSRHKKDNKCSFYKYVNGNFDGWHIEVLEKYPCNEKKDLRRREGEIIKQIATINKNIAGRTAKEYYRDEVNKFRQYYKDNRQAKIEYQREYEKKNKDIINKKRRERYRMKKEMLLNSSDEEH